MRKGFIFNHNLCVGCKACSAACMLENRWDFTAREIYSNNPSAMQAMAVINFSMACNHCDEPACLEGCPASAYYRDDQSGAVIIDMEKCLGCRYCIWNCPFDAPKYNIESGVVEKCNFCYKRLEENLEPACSGTCPTGALSFGQLPEKTAITELPWFPGRNLNPAMFITIDHIYAGPVIVKSSSPPIGALTSGKKDKILKTEWSLILFTFLVTLSVAFNASAIFSIMIGNQYIPLALSLTATFFSVFHLGNKVKSWRSVINLAKSPLSREIVSLILYTLLLIVSKLTEIPAINIASIVSGIILLAAIDLVYMRIPGLKLILHSGQSLITGMLMISFFIWKPLPFIFLAGIKFTVTFKYLISFPESGLIRTARIFRVCILIIASGMLISASGTDMVIPSVIFLTGELIDRVLFYYDFEPENIKLSINNFK